MQMSDVDLFDDYRCQPIIFKEFEFFSDVIGSQNLCESRNLSNNNRTFIARTTFR